jgi:hypothetical protein
LDGFFVWLGCAESKISQEMIKKEKACRKETLQKKKTLICL